MENTITVDIKLRNGEEAMYVTPVSHAWYEEVPKFYKYDTFEFLPNIPYQLKCGSLNDKFHSLQLWCFRATKLAKTTKVIAEVFLDNFSNFTGANVFDSWFQNRAWKWWDSYLVSKELSHDWFYAVDIFQPYEPLHLEGNIEIDWKDSLKYIDYDFSYLSPKSLWVEERLKEKFHVWTFDKEQDKVAEERFWKWRQEQLDKGRDVLYITSLET